MMLSIFSCAYWPYLYLLWGNGCSNFYCLFFLGLFVFLFFFFTIEFSEFFILSRDKSFIIYVICKYFLPVCGLSFYPFNKVSSKEQMFILIFDEVKFIDLFFYESCF